METGDLLANATRLVQCSAAAPGALGTGGGLRDSGWWEGPMYQGYVLRYVVPFATALAAVTGDASAFVPGLADAPLSRRRSESGVSLKRRKRSHSLRVVRVKARRSPLGVVRVKARRSPFLRRVVLSKASQRHVMRLHLRRRPTVRLLDLRTLMMMMMTMMMMRA
jgi:hypothetical protein